MRKQHRRETLKDFGGPGRVRSKVQKRETKETHRRDTTFGGEWGRWRAESNGTTPQQRGIYNEIHVH